MKQRSKEPIDPLLNDPELIASLLKAQSVAMKRAGQLIDRGVLRNQTGLDALTTAYLWGVRDMANAVVQRGWMPPDATVQDVEQVLRGAHVLTNLDDLPFAPV